MRIAVDARHLADGRGVARYTRETLGALRALYPEDQWLVHAPGPGRARVQFGAAALTGRPRLDRLAGGSVDAVWMPAPAPAAVSPGVPLVLTVHDLSWLERPADFTPYERLWHRLARPDGLAHRAGAIVAVSHATANAVAAEWPESASRIAVVHPGVTAPATENAAPACGRRPYLLCVGALEPRKAPELLLRAHASAQLDVDLVFAGAGRLAGVLAGERVRVLGHVDDPRLDALYAGALALVHPSHHEGFGFPPLEALARGTPAVVADLPVYDETLGPAAVRFRPGDAQDLAAALRRIARNEAERRRIVALGARAVAPLTWEACAHGVRGAIEQAVG
jgi:glycosyltransferase involved in cell wall biosynthesis